MLLQTNSYIVPREKRAEHERLVRRFRQAFARLGCEQFEVYEQVGQNWSNSEPTGRFVQLMRFRDRRHQQAVQEAERKDPAAQALIQEFCRLINFPYQQQQGLFAIGFYASMLPVATARPGRRGEEGEAVQTPAETMDGAGEGGTGEAPSPDAPDISEAPGDLAEGEASGEAEDADALADILSHDDEGGQAPDETSARP
jgi:hypothetical protein